MRRRSQSGGVLLEGAMFLPILILLLAGMVELARLSYTFFTLEKTLYTLARYLGTQQGVNFCDQADATVAAAKFYVLTGTTDGSGAPLLPGLTPEMIQVRVERRDPLTGELGACDCAAAGCDLAQGGLAPDFIVVSLVEGYPVIPRIPFLTGTVIPLRPHVRLPYGGT